MSNITHEHQDEIERAKGVCRTVDPYWLVGVTDAGNAVLDGDDFTAAQLEAIAFLLRHSPEDLVERSG